MGDGIWFFLQLLVQGLAVGIRGFELEGSDQTLLPGVIAPDLVTLVVGAASFDSEDVGTQTATAALSLTGADAGNYSLTQPTGLTGVITARALTVTGPAVTTKEYDGNTAAVISGLGDMAMVKSGLAAGLGSSELRRLTLPISGMLVVAGALAAIRPSARMKIK